MRAQKLLHQELPDYDRFENLMSNATFQTTVRRSFSPQPAAKQALMQLREDVMSPQRMNVNKLAYESLNRDLYNTPRF